MLGLANRHLCHKDIITFLICSSPNEAQEIRKDSQWLEMITVTFPPAFMWWYKSMYIWHWMLETWFKHILFYHMKRNSSEQRHYLYVKVWSPFLQVKISLARLSVMVTTQRGILLTLNLVDFLLNNQWHTSVPKTQPVSMHRNSFITACWQSSWPRPRSTLKWMSFHAFSCFPSLHSFQSASSIILSSAVTWKHNLEWFMKDGPC